MRNFFSRHQSQPPVLLSASAAEAQAQADLAAENRSQNELLSEVIAPTFQRQIEEQTKPVSSIAGQIFNINIPLGGVHELTDLGRTLIGTSLEEAGWEFANGLHLDTPGNRLSFTVRKATYQPPA